MADSIYRIKMYTEFEVTATTEEEAVMRFTDALLNELDEGKSIVDIAEIGVEILSDNEVEA